MTNEIHPVVELLIARMESHPEEFMDDYLMSEVRPAAGSSRWFRVIHAIREHGSKRDVETLNAALSKIHMQQIHEWTMDELLNGEDRRREEEERKKQLWQQQQQMHQQAYQQSPHLQSGMQNVSHLGGWQQAGLLGAASPPGEDSLMQQIRKRLIK
jgi:hypothetical protein